MPDTQPLSGYVVATHEYLVCRRCGSLVFNVPEVDDARTPRSAHDEFHAKVDALLGVTTVDR